MKERQIGFDVLRVLAMFMVLVNHTVASEALQCQSWTSTLSCSVAMTFSRLGVPLFLMLSGALLLRREDSVSLKNLYGKRLLKIVFPLITWSVLYFILYDVIEYRDASLTGFLNLIVTPGHAGHLWYLYVLVVLYALLPVFSAIVRATDKKLVPYLLLLWLVVSGVFRFIADFGILPLSSPYISLHIFNGLWGYYLLGWYLSTQGKKCGRLWKWLAGIVFVALSAALFAEILRSGTSAFTVVSYSGLPIIFISAVIFLALLGIREIRNQRVRRVITFLSDISFSVYLNQFLARAVAQRIVALITDREMPSILLSFLFTTLISILCATAVYMLPKNRITDKIRLWIG